MLMTHIIILYKSSNAFKVKLVSLRSLLVVHSLSTSLHSYFEWNQLARKETKSSKVKSWRRVWLFLSLGRNDHVLKIWYHDSPTVLYYIGNGSKKKKKFSDVDVSNAVLYAVNNKWLHTRYIMYTSWQYISAKNSKWNMGSYSACVQLHIHGWNQTHSGYYLYFRFKITIKCEFQMG